MIDYLSYSSISSFLSCGKAWKYKYIDQIPTKPNASLIVGSCVHDTVEEVIRCNSLGIEVPDMAETARTALSSRLEKAEGINGTPEVETIAEDVLRIVSAPLVQSGVKYIRAKVDADGAMIERKVMLEVPEVDVPIIGYIDIILEDGTPADFKTAAKSWTAERAAGETQPVFYLAAMGQCGFPVNWQFKHLVMVKTKQPKFQILEHTHKPEELFKLFSQVQNVWKGITAGVFNPAAPGSWKCSPRWCDYYDLCQGG